MIEKDWLFSSDEYICDLRTVGVLVKNNRVLVQRDKNGSEYALPGGHIKIGETLEAGLVREYKEETGVDIEVKRLLWSEECFWEWNGKLAHCNYPCVKQTRRYRGSYSHHILQSNSKMRCYVPIGWMDIEEIQNVTIYPEFIKTEIHNLNGEIKHFISK